MRKQYENLKFLLIESSQFNKKEVSKIKKILNENQVHHKTITIKDKIDKDEFFSKEFSHIISNTSNFPDYEFTQENYIPVVTTEFIYAIEETGKQPTVRGFSADPSHVLKKVHICIGDLPDSDKEIIYGCVRALGGIYNESLNKFVTHVISNDRDEDCCYAVRAIDNCHIKIVKPEWIDDCLKLRRYVNEKPYLLFPEDADQIEDVTPEIDIVNKNLEELAYQKIQEEAKNILGGRTFYLNDDLGFTPKGKEITIKLIERSGGKVIDNLAIAQCYIGKYREGINYISASKNGKHVGSLDWLYWLVANRRWINPNIKLLHYPRVRGGLPEMSEFTISSTNYSGDARFYIKELVEALGATFTTTLTKNETHLIVANATGKKYEHALKWDIKIVNHLWLEETYSKWKLQTEKLPKYSHYPQTFVLNQIVGQTNLDLDVLSTFYSSTLPEGTSNIIEDSEDENLSPFKKASQTKLIQIDEDEQPPSSPPFDSTPIKRKKESVSKTNETTTRKLNVPSSLPVSTPITPQARALSDISANSVRVSSGRKAKDKAAAKLHSDMEDLNLFQKQHKSKDVPLLPEEVEARKRRREEELVAKDAIKASKEQSEEDTKSKKSKKESSPFTSYRINAIITGWENQLTNSDFQLLKNIGIHIFNEFKPSVNAIISPKFMRTEKFLTGLSYRLDYILSPTFITDTLTQFKSDPSNLDDLPNIEDYSIDHTNPKSVKELTNLSLNELLEKSRERIDQKEKVFQNITFNISAKLPGGAATITKILKAHGASDVHVIKSVKDLKAKNPIKPSSDGSRIFISTDKEKGLLEKAKDVLKSSPNSTIVEWDWIVSSIFTMDTTHADHVLYTN